MRLLATQAERILPVVVLLVAIFLRLYSLDTIPSGLMGDEAENELDALAIIDGERPIFLAENHGREALFVYLQAISIAVLGQTDLALRMVSAIVGILTVAATYLLVLRMFGSRAALLTCGWLTLSLWHVIFSRIGLRSISLPLFLAVGFYCLWRGMEGVRSQVEARNASPLPTTINSPRPAILFALGGVVIGLSLYTYSTARFAPFVIVALALYLALLHRQLLRQVLPGLVLALVMSALVFLPLGSYFLNHPEDFVERARIVTIVNPELHEGNPGQALFDSTLRSLGMFAIRGDSSWDRNISGRPIFDPISALLMLIGTVLAMRRFRESAYGFIVIWLALMFVPGVLAVENVPNYLRVTGLIPALFIFPALGAVWLWETWESHVPARLRALPVLLVTLAFLGGTFHTNYNYFELWAKAPEVAQVFTVDRSVPVEVFCKMVRTEHRPIFKSDLLEPELPVPARFGEQVFVYGFDLPKDVRAGETMMVRWYWRILSIDEREFAFTSQLFGEDDRRHGQADERCFIPDYWSVGTSGVSTLSIQVDPEASTGAYWLHAAIYDRSRQRPSNLPVFDPQGNQAGNQLILGPIKVHGRRPAQASAAENHLPASFADQIDLLGYSLGEDDLAPGGSLDLTLFWSPRGRPSRDYTVFVHLLDSQEQIRGQADSPPRDGRYPTSIWDAGEVIADLHTLALGTDLPAGEYHVAIGLYDPETGERVGTVDENGQIAGDRVIISGLAVDG